VKQLLEHLHRIKTLFLAGAEHTGQDGMGFHALLGAIAAERWLAARGVE